MRGGFFSLCLLCAALLSSCGTDSHHFKFEGHFLNMNQGEFYVYSPDGAIAGFDTIRVSAGRFAYEIPCDEPATLVIVFPNYSEQPVFAQPGKSVSLKADVQHLKEMEARGTKDNELMTKYRKLTSELSPPEVARQTVHFIEDHPESRVSVFLLSRQFVQTSKPDLQQASRLTAVLMKAQPKNGRLRQINDQLAMMKASQTGARLPAFTATDVRGRHVGDAQLRGALAVVYTWSTWNFESQELQRQLQSRQRRAGARLQVVSLCLDPSSKECLRVLDRDSIRTFTVCDGLMFESPLRAKLGLCYLPDNLLLKNGKVEAHHLSQKDLLEKIDQSIGK